MNNIQIRLGHTDSVNSVDRQNFLDVELKNTSKLSHFTDIKATIDQYEQFNTERENCNKYRLILTINPYCTNVLFNPFTEIVYAEGASEYRNSENVILFDGCEAIVDGDTFWDNDKDKDKEPEIEKDYAKQLNNVYGNTEPNRVQMIMNTEYSRPGCANDSKDKNGREITDENYVYHPGYDIFNNHILRNKSFKIVNKPKVNNHEQFFNTIADKMRYADGEQVKYRRRESLQDDTMPERDKHLYDYADILQFSNGDAINANLTEENGWYGFINTSTIQSRDSNFDELNIGRVLNDHKSCEFIDMYPDRTLYSFNPKYNKYQHREEYNWEVILTYPYAKTNEYDVVRKFNAIIGKDEKDEDIIVKDCTALTILSAVRTMGPSGETIILFRSMTKHGLKRGDTVRFYYKNKEGEEWKQYEKNFIVRNIGNLNNDEKEYYFYINDMDFIRLLPGDGSLDDTSDNELSVDDDYEYRFARIVGNVPSRYYIRVFKKLPNFKYAEQKFPTDGSMTIDEYINNNAKYPEDFMDDKKRGKMVSYDKEQYKLAFESTIYNDDSTQIVFTDTIDIDNLVDSRGCPLTEIYATIVKTNYGHDMWYNDKDYSNPDIEFSHCFGPVSEGLQFSQKKGDNNAEYIEGVDIHTIADKRQTCGDVCMLYNNSSPFKNDIDIRDTDVFLGDIVEFNPNECIEKSLQFFMHRFNTAQRELNDGRIFTWNEIWSDDWDADPSDTKNVITDNGDFPFSVTEETLDDDKVTQRHEGYFYQPHYRIPLREFGAIIQGQHYDVNINKIEPVQADAIYLKIVTKTRSGVNKGDIIYLFDDKNNKVYDFIVTYVENRVSFYVMPYVKEGNPWQIFNLNSKLNWLDICNLAVPNDGGEIKLYFRIKNEEIPPYAEKVGKNKYLWREVLKPGNMDVQNLPEYAYSNNAFYISNEINFFLKRQDPQGWNNLYYEDGFPNDIPGKIKKESNYIYKEEKEVIC